MQVKAEEVRRGSKQGEQQAVTTQLLGARNSVRSTIEARTGDPHKSLRWVTRLREARQLAQGHTACLVRLRHGQLPLHSQLALPALVPTSLLYNVGSFSQGKVFLASQVPSGF